MTVNRYEHYGGYLLPHPNGLWMRYEDVEELAENYTDLFRKYEQAIKERNDALEKLRKLKLAIKHTLLHYNEEESDD